MVDENGIILPIALMNAKVHGRYDAVSAGARFFRLESAGLTTGS